MLKMLLSENFLKSVVDHMKVADIFDSLLFEWNCKQNRFQLKSGRNLHVYQCKFFTCLLFGVLVFLQTLCTWNNANIFAKINSLFFMCALFTFSYFHIIFRSMAQLIVSYLNALLVFENLRKGKHFNKNLLPKCMKFKPTFSFKVDLGITMIVRTSPNLL